jgi:hypothetical protein
MRTLSHIILAILFASIGIFACFSIALYIISFAQDWSPIIKGIAYFAFLGWMVPAIPSIILGKIFKGLKSSSIPKYVLSTTSFIMFIILGINAYSNLSGMEFIYSLVALFFGFGAVLLDNSVSGSSNDN